MIPNFGKFKNDDFNKNFIFTADLNLEYAAPKVLNRAFEYWYVNKMVWNCLYGIVCPRFLLPVSIE